ncbi:trypsin-like serine peptidase [Pedobacter rhizosphaerae]|uniref:Trypsin-like peptidase domain-containing protein n=1 Tax=Pedobacter rhizosphaerae TaxID=390241 RepID=A0A1H9T0D0_9SPHI|nr:trypsin-like peptidase domain-containing protein [Pedobacter rhizosphaerae]SER90712.1 Trypsin-like peptidase domain-containing protein [Pedobacter rhizosphaerae]
MNISPADALSALKTTRREFGAMFIQAQNRLPINERYELETIAIDTTDDPSALLKALGYAQINQFYEPLLTLIVQSGLESGMIAQAMIDQNTSINQTTLQSIANANGFTEPHTYYQGIAKGMKWTGKLIIPGQHAGTGILIGPNLFLSAWHVVKSLFNPDRSPKRAVSAVVEFDNYLYLKQGLYNQNDSETVKLHQDWHVGHCRCHDQELIAGSPLNPDCFENNWDYVILRLERAVGFDRGWAKLDSRAVVPPEQQKIVIFQHAGGEAMRIDENVITGIQPSHPSIPKHRFLHLTNTLGGSSGGPCFDKEFSLIGIHQGSWPEQTAQGTPAVATARARNRGVPIVNIIEHIKKTITELPLPLVQDSPLYWLREESFEPIIGCDAFQSQIWSMVLRQEAQVLSITGEPYSGKSFLLKVAQTLLSDQRHLKINLPAERISKIEVTELLAFISSEIGVQPPPLTAFSDFDNTAPMWLRNHIAPELTNMLNLARNGRLVWLFLSDLNRFNLEGAHVAEFVLTLLDTIQSYPWLRIVLDGNASPLPQAIRPLAREYRSRTVTRADVADYLGRSFTRLEIHEDTAPSTRALFKAYQRNLIERPESALSELRNMAMDILNDIVDQ